MVTKSVAVIGRSFKRSSYCTTVIYFNSVTITGELFKTFNTMNYHLSKLNQPLSAQNILVSEVQKNQIHSIYALFVLIFHF